MTFPLSFALIPYALVCLLCAVLAMFAIFHFVKYSETTGVSFVAVFAYCAGTAFLLFFTWSALRGTDWGYPISFASVFSTNTHGMDSFSL